MRPLRRSHAHAATGCWDVAAAALTACGIPMPLPGARTEQRASTAYEQKAARHLYQRYAARIYRGQLPAMLYAVAVLEIHVSGHENQYDAANDRLPKPETRYFWPNGEWRPDLVPNRDVAN